MAFLSTSSDRNFIACALALFEKQRVTRPIRLIGFGVADVGERTWLSPTCGLAGASPDWARGVGGVLREASRMLGSGD